MTINPKIPEKFTSDLCPINSASLDQTVELLQKAKKTNAIDQAVTDVTRVYNFLKCMPSADSKILSAANNLSKYCKQIAFEHYQYLAEVNAHTIIRPDSFSDKVFSIAVKSLDGYLNPKLNTYPNFSNPTDQENHKKAMAQAGKLHKYVHSPLHFNIEDLKQAASYANDLLTYISDKDSSYIAAAHYIAFYFNSKLSVAYKELAKDHTFLPS